MARRQDDCVDMESLAEGQASEELMCSICLQFMVKPYRTNCHGEGKHLYGYNCIKKWSSQGEKKSCPLCRTPFTELSPYLELQERIQSAKSICKDCHQLQPVRNISTHELQCLKRQQRLRSELAEVVEREKACLQVEITPHLQEQHLCIFEEHVREWEWLLHDPRNWKWWWWASMPWWNNQTCATCNDLWHKYEDDVDREEAQRVSILEELGIAEEKKQVLYEKVRCQNQ